MCRGMLWCYVLVLTLVDISPHTKLTALGKSHDITLHDSLVEGINFQEWGGEGLGEEGAAPSGVALRPASLHFGPAALAAPHARSVTLTNTGNTTLHLASVAGTTPDFHASFFESKTLAPRTNTTFSVVYLGRRAGHVAAHLYIHTSLGVYNYPVSAVGVASEYEVWPLVGVRVPANASVEPVLALHNPTDRVLQVTEVYSSGAWVGLQLPAGGASAPRAAWAVPPHATRDIVRLRLAPPPPPAPPLSADEGEEPRALTAYVRLKANVPGGALVVCVEARAAPPGEHAAPLHLHMRARGAADPALTVRLRAGNSARGPVRLEAAVRGARCVAEPRAPPDPCEPPRAHAHNGGVAGDAVGARLALLRADLPPLSDFTDVADLTLDYGELWASAEGAEGAAGAVRCAGCVWLGRVALPYSLRLVPGTLRLDPAAMHFVRAGGGALRAVSLRAHNTSPLALQVAGAALSADAAPYFQLSEAGGRALGAGRSATLARLQLLPAALRDNVTLAGALTLSTNLSDYRVPLLVYSGRFLLEWERPWGGEGAAEEEGAGAVSLGALGTSASRRVGVRLRNPAPAPLCARELAAELSAGSAQFTLAACPAAPPDHPCRCVEGGAWAQAWLVVVAPARAGELRGHVRVRSQHASTDATLSLRALPGRLHAPPLQMPDAAPYVWSAAELVLESTMELEMFVTKVTQPAPDPALSYIEAAGGGRAAVRTGRQAVGRVLYAPELHCHPDCYTGLDLHSHEGRAWRGRVEAVGAAIIAADGGAAEEALAVDVALVTRRLAAFQRQSAPANLSLHLHTTEVMQIPVSGTVRLQWPRLVGGAVGAEGLLAAVGAVRSLRVSVRNPSGSHPLLLQPVLAGELRLPAMAGGEQRCNNRSCVWAPHAFRLAGWHVVRGDVLECAQESPGAQPARPAPWLLLLPRAQVDFTLNFAPQQAALLAAYLYLRNNLTIVEGVLLTAEGVHPSFELAGRKPGSSAPILLEVSECGEASGPVGAGVRRSMVVRNTGRVGVRLREWRVAGRPCQARGFRLQPCAPLALAPNESRALHLAFAPDFTLSRVSARLQLLTDHGPAEFRLQAAVPARLLPRCAASLPRPPWEPALRRAAMLIVFVSFLLVIGVAVFDGERLLRRARASRLPPQPRAPLDLRHATRAAPVATRAAPAATPRDPPPARRRRAPRRSLPPLDPLAERRAFERWRAEVLRRADDEESHSSEDTDSVCVEAESPPHPAAHPAPPLDRQPCESRPDSPHDSPPDSPIDSPPDTPPDTPPDSPPDSPIDSPPDTPAATPPDSPPDTPPVLEEYAPDPDPDDDEDRPSNSADEECISTGSSSPASLEPEELALHPLRLQGESRVPAPPLEESAATSAETSSRPSRARRDSADAGRRLERARLADDTAKQQPRKEKSVKRRSERPSAPPSRGSPAPLEAEVTSAGTVAPGALRWGASWSSVVAARALAPIGSDVRRRAPAASAPHPAAPAGGAGAGAGAGGEAAGGDNNSLFYFNGAASGPRAEAAWRAPAVDRSYRSPSRDYLGDTTGVGSVGSVGAVGSVGSVGSAGSAGPGGVLGSAYTSLEQGGGWGGAWAWGAAGAVRPPPGFSAPPRPPRAYDPFHSLASIWAPGAADWRYEPADAPSPAPAEPEER